jgi:hypothetical protein
MHYKIQQNPAEKPAEKAPTKMSTKTSRIQPNLADFFAFANAFFKKSSGC